MRQFIVITKDGSKWLRPTDVLSGVFDVIYIGSHPEGTTGDESEVREVRQFKDNGEWVETSYENYMEDDELGLPVRTAYTDAEPHDRHISDDYPSIDYQPLFNHMSKEHGLTLTISEMDEIIGLSTYILAKK